MKEFLMTLPFILLSTRLSLRCRSKILPRLRASALVAAVVIVACAAASAQLGPSCQSDVSQSETCLDACHYSASMHVYVAGDPYGGTTNCLTGVFITNWVLSSMNGSESWSPDINGDWT